MQPPAAALRRVLAGFDPQLRLRRSFPLDGGTSTQVTAIETEPLDGHPGKLVLRQYGPGKLRADSHAALHEHALLTLLHTAGLPVPRPYRADESGTVLPGPYLVTEFVDGQVPGYLRRLRDPADLAGFTSQLAVTLADLHAAGPARHDVSYLPEMTDVASRRLGAPPPVMDAELDEAAIRAAVTASWPPPQANVSVLLHGDYWPGNTLWSNERLVALIDWEDAAFGDPLADLGNVRLEVAMFFGTHAADRLTRQYLARQGGLELTALPHWDLYAALRPAGTVSGWGLPPDLLATARAAHREFAGRALDRLRGGARAGSAR